MRTTKNLRVNPWVGIIFIVSFGLSSAGAQEIESIDFSLDPAEFLKWKVGNSQQNEAQAITEFVPKEETVENWSKMLTIQSVSKANSSWRSAERFMNLLKDSIAKKCPRVIWSVIEKTKRDILFEWRVENCPQNADQHQVQRLLDGKWNGFNIAYVRKVTELPPDEREQWLKVLRESKIVIKKN